jgi:hypothetical protein
MSSSPSHKPVPSRSKLRELAANDAVRSAPVLSKAELAGILVASLPSVDRWLAAGDLEPLVIRLGASVRFKNPLLVGFPKVRA